MHHGYYPDPDFSDHTAAQILMIEQSLKWGLGLDAEQCLPRGFFSEQVMLDVGCGVGGSSRYIVRNHGGKAVGITLSSVQVAKANELSAAANLTDQLTYTLADALHMPFGDDSFDLSECLDNKSMHVCN